MNKEKLILKKNKIEHYIEVENVYYSETLSELKGYIRNNRLILQSRLKSSIRRLSRYTKKLNKVNKKI